VNDFRKWIIVPSPPCGTIFMVDDTTPPGLAHKTASGPRSCRAHRSGLGAGPPASLRQPRVFGASPVVHHRSRLVSMRRRPYVGVAIIIGKPRRRSTAFLTASSTQADR